MHLRVALCACILAVVALPNVAQAKKSIHHVRPEACKKCHEEVYLQWSESMHADSSALKDPIHGAFYRNVMGDPTEEGVRGPQIPVKKDKYPVCLKCHAPVAAIDGKTKLDAKKAYANGVSCVTCHSFSAFKGVDGPDGKPRYGVGAYETDDGHVYGPSGITYTTKRTPDDAKWPTPVHHPQPMVGNQAALYKSNDICMGCHDKRKNFHGTPLCLTGAEYGESKTFVNCQACHMPIVTVPKRDKGKIIEGEFVTIADHTMGGGHDAKMVGRGLAMTMELTPSGDTLAATVTLRNRLPHSYPTGAPFRNMYVKVAAYDAEGNEVWKNYETHPIVDDPKSMFMFTIGDVDKGQPTSPPYATGVLNDSRLQPNETRVLEYAIPADERIAIVRAEALYNLLLPNLVKDLGDKLTEDLRAPKVAASVEFRL
jgi:hypothetical protein